MRIVALLAVVAAVPLVTACSTRPPLESFSLVLPETAIQMVCWEERINGRRVRIDDEGLAPESIRGVGSECLLDRQRTSVSISDLRGGVPETSPDRIAGRPASARSDEVQINLLRVNGAYSDKRPGVTLRFSGGQAPDQLRPLAEKVLPLLLP